jgi:hypothetical protein
MRILLDLARLHYFDATSGAAIPGMRIHERWRGVHDGIHER